MAGIGFELERMFEQDTYSGDIAAYTSAGLILAGSWVFGVMAIVVITIFQKSDLGHLDQSIFICMATYSYAGAMLITGGMNLPVTRYIADRLYMGRADAFGPTFASFCIIHWIVAFIVGGVFYGLNPLSVRMKIMGILLLASSCQVWLAAAFIALLRVYGYTAFCFFVGYLVSTIGAVGLGRYFGLEGYMAGFTLGMSLLAVMLTGGLMVQFSYPKVMNFEFFGTVRKRPALYFIGLLIAIGTWGDKFLFWFSADHSFPATPYLRFYPDYDISFFLGYITGVPALAHFLLRIETSFARHVRHIYSALMDRENYQEIHQGKIALSRATNEDFVGLIKLQAPIALLAIYFAPSLIDWLKLEPQYVHIFQYTVLTIGGIILLQVQILYLLYFDLAGAALIPAAVYGVGNPLFTWMTIRWAPFGYWSYGLGHMLAAYLAFLSGYFVLNYNIKRLDYIVLTHFARQTVQRARKAA